MRGTVHFPRRACLQFTLKEGARGGGGGGGGAEEGIHEQIFFLELSE